MSPRSPTTTARSDGVRLLAAVGAVIATVWISQKGMAQLPAQDFLVDEWTQKDGLTTNAVSALAQTPDGFLWLGTPKGLVRFDGVRFFSGPVGTTEAEQDITALHVDRKGTLWVASRSGKLGWLSPPTLDWQVQSVGTVGERILKLSEDRDGTLWISSRSGAIAAVRKKDSKYELHPDAAPGLPISILTVDGQGNAWGLNQGRLCTVRDGRWQRVGEDGPRGASLMCSTRAGHLMTVSGQWWSTRGPQIYQVGTELTPTRWGKGPTTSSSPRFRLMQMMEDSSGHLWLATFGSGVFYSITNGTWQFVATASALANSRINCLFEDREGSVWIGTEGNGLFRARRRLVNAESLPSPERNHLIQTVSASHDGGVWVGTDGAGLYKYRSGKFELVGMETENTNLFVSSVLEDRQTNVWISSASGFWQLKDGNIEKVDMAGGALRSLRFLFEDTSGRVWAGNKNRIMRKTGSLWQEVRLDTAGKFSDVRAIADGANGTVWIACGNNGLYCVEGEKIRALGEEQEPGLAQIQTLFGGRDGKLWIGTAGAGLLCYADGEFSRWSSRDGLPSDMISGIIEDAQGALWMTSDNGVFACSKQQLDDFAAKRTPHLLCRQFSVADGLADLNCSGLGQPTIIRSSDQRIWFCNKWALGSIPPTTIRAASAPPTVFTEEVRADGKVFRISGAHIPTSTRRLEFHFTSPQLANPKANPKRLYFRYQLEGMDRDWLDAGVEPIAYYGQLPPGEYDFRVMVGDSRGGWQESAKKFRLLVIPAWWQTVWFRIAVGFGTITAIAGIAIWNERRKLTRKLERLKAQQALENERRRIARDLHDDLGSQLTEIFLTGELAKRGLQTLPELQHQLGSMTQKVRSLVSSMEEVVWTINPRHDSLSSLVAYLCDFLERFLAPTSIRTRLDVEDELPELPVAAQTRHNLLLAVKEAANNALKHSHATEVALGIKFENGVLTIVLEDNGTGFDAEHPPKSSSGNGLTNLKSRLEDLGGQTFITSKPGAGTQVKFILPLASGNSQTDQPAAASPTRK